MISVNNLKKTYKITKKGKGFVGFLKNIFTREYKIVKAVDNISFEIGEGELVGLIGPNGAGKTSTMKILAGILYPTSGKVSVLGYTPFDKNKQFLKQIAFVMGQKNQLLWDLPAYDSFLINKAIYELDDTVFKKTLDNLTQLLNCSELIDHPVKTLSLGERMKMELIASVLHQPKVLFLDEPTIGLDVVAQKIIRDFIKVYQNQYKATILLTSHYMEDVKQLAKRVMIINFGKIIYDGKLDQVIKQYVKTKTITVILEEKPDKKVLQQIDSYYRFDWPKAVFKVDREALEQKVELISRNLSFADITIEEERIENIIRKIFEKK